MRATLAYVHLTITAKQLKKHIFLRFYRVLTIVYSTGSFGLFPSSGVLGGRNTTFRKLDLFPSSGEGGEDTY
jgi:hypothetical protein